VIVDVDIFLNLPHFQQAIREVEQIVFAASRPENWSPEVTHFSLSRFECTLNALEIFEAGDVLKRLK